MAALAAIKAATAALPPKVMLANRLLMIADQRKIENPTPIKYLPDKSATNKKKSRQKEEKMQPFRPPSPPSLLWGLWGEG